MGRCGSTWLTSLLDSHPAVKCRAEEFSLENGQGTTDPSQRIRRIGKFFDDPARINPTTEQTLHRLTMMFDRQGDACGFKFKYANQVQSYPEIMNALREMKSDLKVIHLTRANHLKRAISRQNLVRRLEGSSRVETLDSEPDENRKKKLVVDIPFLLSFLKRQKRQFDRLELIVSEFPNVLNVEYEELVDNHDVVVRSLLQFLDVDEEVLLKTNIVKATPDRLQDIVVNYDEMLAALHASPYAHFLEMA